MTVRSEKELFQLAGKTFPMVFNPAKGDVWGKMHSDVLTFAAAYPELNFIQVPGENGVWYIRVFMK
jgi:hypothetical protein